MLRALFILGIWLIGASGAVAQQGGLVTLSTGQDGRGWEAVGRIDIDGKGFCTGVLIREDLVLTAAHCVYDHDGRPIAPEKFEFLAGLRSGRAEAYRDVRRVVAHPDFRPANGNGLPSEVASDIALLQLSQPIRTTRIEPFRIAARPYAGEAVGVVSYARDRQDAPSLQQVCEVLGQQEGVLVLTCDVDFGASGSPVFRVSAGVAQIVSVVSAMAMLDTRKVSLGTSLEAPLQTLLAVIDGTVMLGGQPVLLSGERSDTGAKFVRP